MNGPLLAPPLTILSTPPEKPLSASPSADGDAAGMIAGGSTVVAQAAIARTRAAGAAARSAETGLALREHDADPPFELRHGLDERCGEVR